MPMMNADSPLAVLGRTLGLGVLVIGAAFAAVFAAAAAVVVGLLIMGAALALKFAPKPVPVRSDVLEARRTPAGWVVETAARRKS